MLTLLRIKTILQKYGDVNTPGTCTNYIFNQSVSGHELKNILEDLCSIGKPCNKEVCSLYKDLKRVVDEE